MRRLTIYLFLILSLFRAEIVQAGAVEIPWLENLNLGRNTDLQAIRRDIRTGLYVVKGYRNPSELPGLRFYRYRVQRDDTFWKILSRTSLDMDTLVSVNTLGSPDEIQPGKVIYIPNMRGTIMSGSEKDKLEALIRSAKIHPDYIRKANGSESLDREHLFVPCGRISILDRSLFLGTAFTQPAGAVNMTSRFGMRRDPFGKKYYSFHGGVDFSCPLHSTVRSTRKGRVIFSGYEGGYGNLIIIEHERGYHSYYGHLSRMTVKPGDTVETGQLIGLSGNSGRSTGPHLHFEVRRNNRQINPSSLLR